MVKVTFRRDLPGFDPKQQKNLGWNETHDQSSQKEKTIRYNIMLVCTAIIWLASEVRAWSSNPVSTWKVASVIHKEWRNNWKNVSANLPTKLSCDCCYWILNLCNRNTNGYITKKYLHICCIKIKAIRMFPLNFNMFRCGKLAV